LHQFTYLASFLKSLLKLSNKSYIEQSHFSLTTDFKRVFEQLELQRSEILSVVAALDNDFLTRSPRRNKWSIMQILTHVMTAEELSIHYMQKKVLGIDQVGDSGPVETIKFVVLKMSQRVPLKYTAPKIVVSNTPTQITFPQLKARWDANRRDLKKLLDSIPESKSKRLIFKHVVVGRLDVLQAMQFFLEHFNHHLPQITSILKHNSTEVAST
jgi:uncharacterized damage-inducible protein DinB